LPPPCSACSRWQRHCAEARARLWCSRSSPDLLLGRPAAQAAFFGVTPDPTAIATLGLLLLMQGGGRAVLWPIPLAWCAISGATLWAMNAPEALLPPAAGTAALALRLIGARASMRRSRLAREHGEGR